MSVPRRSLPDSLNKKSRIKSKQKEFVLKPREKKNEKNLDNLDELDDTIDFNQLLNLEFQKLSREYRELEDVNNLMLEKMHADKSKGNRMIDLLEAERYNLDADLTKILAPEWAEKDAENRTNIMKIMEEWEENSEALKLVFRDIREVQERVNKIIQALVAQKLRIQQIFGQAQTLHQVDKKRRILENRLYLFTTRYDSKMSETKQLREELDKSFKTRDISYKTLRSLKKQIDSIRNFINDIVIQCCGAYGERDGLKQRLQHIRDKDTRETKIYLNDIVEFERQIKLDKWNYQFALHKNNFRNQGESDEQRQERKRWIKYSEKLQLLASYEKSFARVLKCTKQKSIESLRKIYKEREQSNFSKFLCLTDKNYEMMKIKDDVEDLVKVLDVQKIQDNEGNEETQNKMNEWDQVIKSSRDSFESLKKLREEIASEMKETRKLIGKLFKVGGCEYTGVQMLLGTNEETVTLENSLHFMKSIELKILDMMNKSAEYEAYKRRDSKDYELPRVSIQEESEKQAGIDFGGPYDPQILITGQLEDTEEDNARDKPTGVPRTYQELKNEILEQVRLEQEALAVAVESSIMSVRSSTDAKMHTTQAIAEVETESKLRESILGSQTSLIKTQEELEQKENEAEPVAEAEAEPGEEAEAQPVEEAEAEPVEEAEAQPVEEAEAEPVEEAEAQPVEDAVAQPVEEAEEEAEENASESEN